MSPTGYALGILILAAAALLSLPRLRRVNRE
jgi:hypothetical protein